MSGIFKVQNTGFAAQAFKAIVLNPQRHFTSIPIRRYGGLLSIAPQSLQSRQPKTIPFNALIQKAPIADGVIFVSAVAGLYYLARRKSERKSKEDAIKNIINKLKVFDFNGSENEQIAYANRVLKALEPYFARAYVLKDTNLKDYVKSWSSITSEAELSLHVIDQTIDALRYAERRISSLNEFDKEFLDHIAIFWSLPRYPKCSDGFSLLVAVKP